MHLTCFSELLMHLTCIIDLLMHLTYISELLIHLACISGLFNTFDIYKLVVIHLTCISELLMHLTFISELLIHLACISGLFNTFDIYKLVVIHLTCISELLMHLTFISELLIHLACISGLFNTFDIYKLVVLHLTCISELLIHLTCINELFDTSEIKWAVSACGMYKWAVDSSETYVYEFTVDTNKRDRYISKQAEWFVCPVKPVLYIGISLIRVFIDYLLRAQWRLTGLGWRSDWSESYLSVQMMLLVIIQRLIYNLLTVFFCK